jgi:GAF domain-containing protein
MGHLDPTQNSQAASEKKLKAYARELEKKLEARTRELSGALEQQAATAEVLRVISSSPSDLQPVLDTILANATRLCEAKFGFLFLRERDNFRGLAMHGAVATPYADWWRREPVVDIRERPHVPLARIARHKEVLHIPDLKADQAYIERDPRMVAFIDSCGARSNLHVPMLKESELVGVITIYRQEVRPFTDKQIEIVQSFANQAVIAIENTRLLNELRQRTDDLSEALEQQTAASQVLQVISSSNGELEPVFQAILASATRTCDAKFALLYGIKNGGARIISKLGIPPGIGRVPKAWAAPATAESA